MSKDPYLDLCATQKHQTSWNDPSQRDVSCSGIIDWIKLETRPSSLRNLAKVFFRAYLIFWLDLHSLCS